MICDGNKKPMCIAGVFGGEESGVSENTSTIFLESAYFNPSDVRKSSQNHQLKTDLSRELMDRPYSELLPRQYPQALTIKYVV